MNDLKVGTIFIFEDQPYEVIEARHYKVQQRRPVLQTKIRNLLTGQVRHENFQTFHTFEEAEVTRKKVKYLYNHRDNFFFAEISDASKRFSLPKNQIENVVGYLKPNAEVNALIFQEKIASIEVPTKMNFKVIETAPGVRGNTESGGTKDAILETGLVVKVPLFVETGDIIRINTKTGQYDSRIQDDSK